MTIQLKIKRFFTLLFAYIACMSVWASPIQAAAPLGSYDTPLTVAAIALNLPYPVHLLCSKNESLYDRLSYRGKYQEALLNHSLNVVSFTALSSELPAKHLFLTGAILFGIQTSTHFFCKSYGVSLIWSGLTGMLFHRLCIQKQFKWHLLLALLLNSATLVYYGYNSSAQTTIAHLSGVVAGFGLSFLLPYKKSSPSVK